MGRYVHYREDEDEPPKTRIDDHLEQALESCEDEQAKYHIREALGLLRI